MVANTVMTTPTTSPSEKKNSGETQIHKFGEILQKFGLNLIQSIGEMKHTLSVLAEKIERIESELIEIKGIKTQLQENSKLREEFISKSDRIEKQVKLLHSKIDQYNIYSSASTQKDETVPMDPLKIFQNFEIKIQDLTSLEELKILLKQLKEQIYMATGGHRILVELRTYENMLQNSPRNTLWDDIMSDLTSRMDLWKQSL